MLDRDEDCPIGSALSTNFTKGIDTMTYAAFYNVVNVSASLAALAAVFSVQILAVIGVAL